MSWLGTLWCTCCVGVAVMLWSGDTVLDKGSTQDPRINFLSGRWWSYVFAHITWWRVVGLVYVAVSVAMAIAALAWLVWDLVALRDGYRNSELHTAEHLFVKWWSMRVWNPDHSRSAPPRRSSAPFLL